MEEHNESNWVEVSYKKNKTNKDTKINQNNKVNQNKQENINKKITMDDYEIIDVRNKYFESVKTFISESFVVFEIPSTAAISSILLFVV